MMIALRGCQHAGMSLVHLLMHLLLVCCLLFLDDLCFVKLLFASIVSGSSFTAF